MGGRGRDIDNDGMRLETPVVNQPVNRCELALQEDVHLHKPCEAVHRLRVVPQRFLEDLELVGRGRLVANGGEEFAERGGIIRLKCGDWVRHGRSSRFREAMERWMHSNRMP